ncbi:MAG: type II toxin-antitoxin system prevent-host-death family antitoxin, partial [Bifidobacteriaceae bacterium]|nr:type II toxin-antitoxin system prevent-host-death family antitoxin [Bifidobacteriaceae bacterium]
LRQNASAVIRRVEAGEEIEVTVQGRPAAVIVPIAERRTRVKSMPGGELMRRIAGMRGDTTGWLEDIRSLPDEEDFRNPWDRA